MKLFNLFAFIFIALGITNTLAEYDKVLCESGTTPVQVPGGWQCQTARAGDPQMVYPKEETSAGFDSQYECKLRPEYQQDYIDYDTEQDMSPEHDEEDYELEEETRPLRPVRNRIRRGPFIASEVYY